MAINLFGKWPQLYATLELLPTKDLKRGYMWVKNNPRKLILGNAFVGNDGRR